MTAYSFTLTLDDGEAVTLQRALDMLQSHSAARIVANDLCPATHDLATIPKIRDKIEAGARQSSGHDQATATIWLAVDDGGRKG